MIYRFGKIKREHSTIKDLIPLLTKVSRNPAITSIIPGRIKPIIGNYPQPILELKMKTQSGFKCSAKSSRSVQEVFIVTDSVDQVILELKKEKLLKV
jgi:hypothetical protein